MRYTRPKVERAQVLGAMATPLSCAFIKCAPGYICVDGECVEQSG